MSNWSVVIVAWSGVDGAAERENLDDKLVGHEARFRKVAQRYAEIGRVPNPDAAFTGWSPHFPCPDERAIGSACEFVAITHENHFLPDALLRALRSFKWESPEQVVVLWKDENVDTYRQEFLAPSPV